MMFVKLLLVIENNVPCVATGCRIGALDSSPLRRLVLLREETSLRVAVHPDLELLPPIPRRTLIIIRNWQGGYRPPAPPLRAFGQDNIKN